MDGKPKEVTSLLRRQLAAVAWKAVEELKNRDLTKLSVRELLMVLDVTARFTLRSDIQILVDPLPQPTNGLSDGYSNMVPPEIRERVAAIQARNGKQ